MVRILSAADVADLVDLPTATSVLESVAKVAKVELHQHTDGSIPIEVTWRLMTAHGLQPVEDELSQDRDVHPIHR